MIRSSSNTVFIDPALDALFGQPVDDGDSAPIRPLGTIRLGSDETGNRGCPGRPEANVVIG